MFHVNRLPSRGFTCSIKSCFLWKTMKRYLWMSSAAVVIGALRVKLYFELVKWNSHFYSITIYLTGQVNWFSIFEDSLKNTGSDLAIKLEKMFSCWTQLSMKNERCNKSYAICRDFYWFLVFAFISFRVFECQTKHFFIFKITFLMLNFKHRLNWAWKKFWLVCWLFWG